MAHTEPDEHEEREDKRSERHDDREDERLLRHDRRILGQRHISGYVLAFAVIVAITLSTATAFLTAKVDSNTHKLAVAAEARDAAAVGECRRVNLLRAQANRNTVALHDALQAVANHISQDIVGEMGVSRAVRIMDLHTLEAQGAKITVTPLTDCQQAVARPLTYQPPKPVPVGPLHP